MADHCLFSHFPSCYFQNVQQLLTFSYGAELLTVKGVLENEFVGDLAFTKVNVTDSHAWIGMYICLNFIVIHVYVCDKLVGFESGL